MRYKGIPKLPQKEVTATAYFLSDGRGDIIYVRGANRLIGD